MPTDEQIIDALEKLKAYGFPTLGRDLVEYRVQADWLDENGAYEVAEWFRGPNPDIRLISFHSHRSFSNFVKNFGEVMTKAFASMSPHMQLIADAIGRMSPVVTPSVPSPASQEVQPSPPTNTGP